VAEVPLPASAKVAGREAIDSEIVCVDERTGRVGSVWCRVRTWSKTCFKLSSKSAVGCDIFD